MQAELKTEEISTIEQVRKYFVDPTKSDTDGFAELGSYVINTLAQIYTNDGDINKLSKDFSRILPDESFRSSDILKNIIDLVLAKESQTRRFNEKFMGQIHPQGNKVAILSMLIAAYMNTNTIVKDVSSSEHKMELEVTNWLCDIFGFQKTDEHGQRISTGNIVTDGTTANLNALWVARQRKQKEYRNNGWGNPREKLIVLAGDMRHYSIDKSCEILGTSFVALPTKGFKTDVDKLSNILDEMPDEKRRRVMAIVALAGETETGMIDDINGLAEITEKYGIYLHVDAAYGGPFILTKKGKPLFFGIDRANSITVDPHKMLYTPYNSAAILFRDRNEHSLIQKKARYLQRSDNEGVLGDPEERNFGFASRVEGSLGSGGVIATWATYKLFGEGGIRSLLDHTIRLTEHVYNKLESNDSILRPLHAPETNSLLIGLPLELRAKFPDNKNGKDDFEKFVEDICTTVDRNTGYYISCTGGVDDGWAAFRFVAMHPYTTTGDVDNLIDELNKEINRRHTQL